MKVVIVREDRLVIVDGVSLKFDFELPHTIWAVNWNENHGEVEYVDDTPNLSIRNFDDYQYLVDAFHAEIARIAEEERVAEITYKASITHAERRQPEYPDVGDQLDDLFRAGYFSPEMAAQIQAVKDKYSK